MKSAALAHIKSATQYFIALKAEVLASSFIKKPSRLWQQHDQLNMLRCGVTQNKDEISSENDQTIPYLLEIQLKLLT